VLIPDEKKTKAKYKRNRSYVYIERRKKISASNKKLKFSKLKVSSSTPLIIVTKMFYPE
jgi:hypothetical protein